MLDDRRGGVLVRHARIADLANEAASDGWLTVGERRELERYRDVGRRTAWLCGRLLGKRLITEATGTTWGRFSTCPNLPDYAAPGRLETCPTEIEILSRDERGRAVRPVVRVRGVQLGWSLSISHSDEFVIAAVSPCDGRCVGIDLVSVDGVKPPALRLWFTPREAELLRSDEPCEAARAWAIKEAAYKALNQGESFAPRRIEITATDSDEFAIRYDGADVSEHCTIETCELDAHVAALVTSDLAYRAGTTIPAADHSLPSLLPA